MKVGSIVECVSNLSHNASVLNNFYPGLKYPVKGEKYTIREVDSDENGVGVWLEEIVNPSVDEFEGEPMFKSKHFCEIEFPPALQEQITESLTRELILK